METQTDRLMGDMADLGPGEAASAPGGGAAHPRIARAPGDVPIPQRDDEAVRRFIEDFASALAEMGVPRMPARVFVALLTSDAGRLTAAELAAQLRASPAAMSGAVRYLIHIGLVRRGGEARFRPPFYRGPADVLDGLITLPHRALGRWTAGPRQGGPHP